MFGATTYLAFLAAFTVLTLRKPHLALVAVLCMFGLDQMGQLYLPFLRSHSTFTNLYILGLVSIALPIAYRSGSFGPGVRWRDCRVRILSCALYLYAFLSLTWAAEGSWSYWVSAWPYIVTSVLFAPLLIGHTGDLREVQRAFIWLGGALVLFLAVVPDWGTRSLLVEGIDDEITAPLALGQLAGYLLIIGICHVRKDPINLAGLIVVIIAALLLAARSGSRGQLIFGIVSALLVVPFIWKRFALQHALQFAFIAVIVVSASAYVLTEANTFTERWQIDDMMNDAEVRVILVKILLLEWIRSPLTILFGLGNSSSVSEALLGIYPHIVPLEVLGEEGMIGAAILVYIVAITIRQAKRIYGLELLSSEVRRVYAANFGCFVYSLLLSLKQGSLITSSIVFLFAVLGEKYVHRLRKEL